MHGTIISLKVVASEMIYSCQCKKTPLEGLGTGTCIENSNLLCQADFININLGARGSWGWVSKLLIECEQNCSS